jgi:formylglycine-generating enzyme required for sulfatase activity
MNTGRALSLGIGLLAVGCQDFKVVLGCNATGPIADNTVADATTTVVDAGASSTDTGINSTDTGASAGDAGSIVSDATATADAAPDVTGADTAAAEAATATSESGTATALSCQPGGAGLSNCGLLSESCCASLEVSGGTFFRTFTNNGCGPTGESDPATVSSFRLDKYLVTVGRFRQFVAAWNGGWVPQAGAGKHTYVNNGNGLTAPGGVSEPGWVASDKQYVAPTDANLACAVNDPEFLPNLAPGSQYSTWTSRPGSQESLPINCVNWYEAYAFCIWDGGFLPSEAEWEYAAFGGSAQLEYPWGSTPPGSGNQYAIFACDYPTASGTCTGPANIAPVGSAPLGAGLWGHLDLLGNLFEWNLDWYAANYVNPCSDCANLTAPSPLARVVQGGDFNSSTFYLPPGKRRDSPTDAYAYAYGIRCARTP